MTTPETGDSSLEDTSVQESAQTASAEDSLYDLPDDEEHQAISENEQGLESPSAPEAEPVEPPKYHVSFRRLEELNRSPVTLVAARRVESCPSMSKPLQELNDPQALITEISRHFQNDPVLRAALGEPLAISYQAVKRSEVEATRGLSVTDEVQRLVDVY